MQQLSSNHFLIYSSRAVRSHWGHLVRTGVVKRDYPHISINNVITLGTRIRIVIMKVILCSLLCHSATSQFYLQYTFRPYGVTVTALSFNTNLQGIADAYLKLHPGGSATVTQFQPRPQLLVRTEPTHRPTIYSYADAVFSAKLPKPTVESLR